MKDTKKTFLKEIARICNKTRNIEMRSGAPRKLSSAMMLLVSEFGQTINSMALSIDNWEETKDVFYIQNLQGLCIEMAAKCLSFAERLECHELKDEQTLKTP